MKGIITIIFVIMNTSIYCQYLGGIGNGEKVVFAGSLTIGQPPSNGLYRGGTSNGETSIALNRIRLSRCNDQKLVWNGNASIFWSIARNWDCGTVPINTSIVTIPSNAIRMPLSANSAKASKVTIATNAVLNLIGNASLTITGQ